MNVAAKWWLLCIMLNVECASLSIVDRSMLRCYLPGRYSTSALLLHFLVADVFVSLVSHRGIQYCSPLSTLYFNLQECQEENWLGRSH